MANSHAVLFSVFTPYQLLIANAIARIHFPTNPIYIIDQRRDKSTQIDDGQFPNLTDVLSVETSGTLKSPRDRREIRRAIQFARSTLTSSVDCRVLLASLDWSLNNCLFSALRRNPSFSFEFSDDGLSTYLYSRAPISHILRRLAKAAYCAAHNLPYTWICSGHALGIEHADIAGIYLAAPQLLQYNKENTKSLDWLKPDAAAKDPVHGIFLVQPYTQHWGTAYLDRTIAFLRSPEHGVQTWDVKLHHFSPPEEQQFFEDAGFEILSSGAPMEALIAASHYGVVSAANSTALFTTKILMGDAIRSLAMCPTSYYPRWETRSQADVVSLFRAAGVEIWDFEPASSTFVPGNDRGNA